MSINQIKSIAIESAAEKDSQQAADYVCVADWFAGKTVCSTFNQTANLSSDLSTNRGMNQTATATAFLRPVHGWSAILH